MMPQPLISVIIPIYNAAPYLERCLDSICNQTYRNLEIILVDDGSTDNSLEICNRYAAKDKRIIAFHQSNKGVSSARNLGLEHATGGLISFVDADDKIDTGTYEKLVSVQQKTNADILWFNIIYVYADGTSRTKAYPQSYCNRLLSLEDFFLLAIGQEDFFCCNKLFAKQVLNANRFNTTISLSEDTDLLTRIAWNAKTIFYIPENLYYYFQNENSLSKTLNIPKRIQAFEISKKLYSRCKQQASPTVADLLKAQLTPMAGVLILTILLYDTNQQYADLLRSLRSWVKTHKKIFSNPFMQLYGKGFLVCYLLCPRLMQKLFKISFINRLLRRKLNDRLFVVPIKK